MCLCVTAEVSPASSLHSPSLLSLFYIPAACLPRLAYALTFSFPPYHPIPPPSPLPLLPPSAACLLVLSRLRWCDCESTPTHRPHPPLQQQTLFTLLLNKPKGEHDPRWHALASSQHILNKLQRKEEKETLDKPLFLSPGYVSISAEKISEWRQWLKTCSN